MFHRQQHTENQLSALERIAVARGLEVVTVFDEHASAVKYRPEWERLKAVEPIDNISALPEGGLGGEFRMRVGMARLLIESVWQLRAVGR